MKPFTPRNESEVDFYKVAKFIFDKRGRFEKFPARLMEAGEKLSGKRLTAPTVVLFSGGRTSLPVKTYSLAEFIQAMPPERPPRRKRNTPAAG